MRVEKSVKNVGVSVVSNILNIIINLVAQAIFLKYLGEEYLGLNGLFTNILSILAIAELGIGTAIIYNLYKPIQEQNQKEIRKLIKFYKKSYKIIILVMVVITMVIAPFIPKIAGNVDGISENLYILYALFVIDILISYVLAYKKSILYADQREYISNLVHIGYLLVMNILQILILMLTQNYILYLIIKIVCRVAENIIVGVIVNKRYSFIKEKEEEELDKSIKQDITKKIKSLFLHKIAGFVVTGTDTILISYFLGGVVTVGYYTNYSLIFSAVTTVFSQIFSSMTASVGNLLVSEKQEKCYDVYQKIQFLNFWLFTFASICIFCLIEGFISIWIGEKYILDKFVLIALTINFFMQGMRRTMMAFKEAAGIFYEDRFVPILEAVINIVASIILIKLYGLAGVFLGTVVSTLIIFLYSYPKFVYQRLFNRKKLEYIKEIFRYLFIAILILCITYLVTKLVMVNNLILKLMINMVVCIVVPNILMYVIYRKDQRLEYYLNIIKNVIEKRKKKNAI